MALAGLSDCIKQRFPDAVQEMRHCEKHGKYVALTLSKDSKPGGCPVCAQESTAQTVAEEIRQAKGEKAKARLEKEIPRRFQSKTFENYSVDVSPEAPEVLETVRAYAENFQENLAAGRSLLLIGKPGTGKNHLGMSLVRHLLLNGFSAQMMDASDLVYRVRATWGFQSPETEADVLRELTSLDLLIINELGVLFRTETEKMVLFRIINRRYETQRPSLVIGNVTREEAEAILGPTSYERLKEDGGRVLVLNWDSYRHRQDVPRPEN